MWVVVALAGITWLAYQSYLDHQKKMAQTGAPGAADLARLTDRMAALEADRERLRARVEALEAIVTDDGFDVARDARRAGLEPRLDLDALPDSEAPAVPPTRTRVR